MVYNKYELLNYISEQWYAHWYGCHTCFLKIEIKRWTISVAFSHAHTSQTFNPYTRTQAFLNDFGMRWETNK